MTIGRQKRVYIIMDEAARMPHRATFDQDEAIDWLKRQERIDGCRRYSLESATLLDSESEVARRRHSGSTASARHTHHAIEATSPSRRHDHTRPRYSLPIHPID